MTISQILFWGQVPRPGAEWDPMGELSGTILRDKEVSVGIARLYIYMYVFIYMSTSQPTAKLSLCMSMYIDIYVCIHIYI